MSPSRIFCEPRTKETVSGATLVEVLHVQDDLVLSTGVIKPNYNVLIVLKLTLTSL